MKEMINFFIARLTMKHLSGAGGENLLEKQ